MPFPKKMKAFSDEQKAFLYAPYDVRFLINSGPVRSGKNFIENIRLVCYLAHYPLADPESDIAFIGTSIEGVRRIFLDELMEILGSQHAEWTNRNSGTGIFKFVDRDGKQRSRKFYTYGYGNAASWSKIHGGTFGGALITEANLARKEVLTTVNARCSIENSQIIMDMNPDSPYHFIYTDYISDDPNDNDLIVGEDKLVFYYTFDSNRAISEKYKERLKRSYKPGSLLYRRMILGQWVAAEGTIYDNFDPDKNVIEPKDFPEFDYYTIAIDYGTVNPFAVLLIGHTKTARVVVDCFYYSGGKEGQKTNAEYVQDIKDFLAKTHIEHGGKKYDRKITRRQIRNIVVDPSAAAFITELRKSNLGIKVRKAVNTVNPKTKRNQTKNRNIKQDEHVSLGIPAVQEGFNTLAILIGANVKALLSEIPKYIWDESAMKRGIERPVKKDDHALDALRYDVNTNKTRGRSNW